MNESEPPLPRNDQKQLRAIDAIGTLRESTASPPALSAERTAISLAGYFKEGGSALRYDTIVDYGIAVLARQRTEEATIKEFETFEHPPMYIEGKQVLRAMVSAYGTRIETCVKVSEKWVCVRGGLGIWLPSAILAKIDGKRRFVIIQPRRSCQGVKTRPSLYLSLFNLYHSIEDNRDVSAEVLDLQCPHGATVRPRNFIHSEHVSALTKQTVDTTLAVYADAMELILKEPKRFGIGADWAESAQQEFELRW